MRKHHEFGRKLRTLVSVIFLKSAVHQVIPIDYFCAVHTFKNLTVIFIQKNISFLMLL